MLNLINSKKVSFLFVNSITFMRFILSVYFSSIVFSYNSNPGEYLVIFFFIAISDFYDGKLAREYGVESKIGGLFDVLTDFFFMISSCISLNCNALLPIWIIILINVKMLEFLITSKMMTIKKSNNFFVFDKFGKAVAVSFYILPIAIIIVDNLFIDEFYFIQNVLLNTICFFTIISMVQRIYHSIRILRK